ncbi:MAG: Zn-dependent alcohol dehydrogenase [Candidatus Poribacteria bacterium]|nr:Zn-dependent alcohol dehydrogenase [Candidatus Poribacteria bacterium]MDE0503933.1 Zn-dependent alcohol dehydrogenase [Candidatus Poribacteria bacterium]
MKAAVLYEPNQPVVVEDIEMEAPRKGEILVKMAATGVCHSCYHVVTGLLTPPLPTVLGDEGAGVVEEIGEGVTLVKPGDHVILSWMESCGHCIYCVQGRSNLCLAGREKEEGFLPDGTTRYKKNGKSIHHFATVASFAEYSVIPETCAVPIDRKIPLDKAALIGCSVTTGVCAATNTAQVRPGSSVAVFGAGGIGLNVIQGAAIAGAEKIIAVDLLASKLAFALEFGATHTVNADHVDPIEAIHALTDGLGVEYSFEAIGARTTYEQALYALRNGGTAVWVGAPPREPLSFDAGVVFWGEKTVKGCCYGSSRSRFDMPRLLALYRAGILKLDELITQTYRLEEVNTAFKDMLDGKVARGMILL